jgi:4-hydroxy-tetrahydrodipicolinate synthase
MRKPAGDDKRLLERSPLGARTGFLDGIWAAVATPFRANGDLDLRGIERNAHIYGQALGLNGIFCNGLMGEGWALSLNERKATLEATLSGRPEHLRVGVVTNHQSLAETLDLSRHAARAGADHLVLMRPGGLFSDDDLDRYVRAVHDATGIPIVLFDSVAQGGGYPMTVLRRLAEGGQIQGVKCTRDWDAINEVRAICGHAVAVADPYESHWLGNLVRFDLRALYADPEPYLFQLPGCRLIHDYYRAYEREDLQTAMDHYRALEPLRSVYERWILSSLRSGRSMNAALKHWCGRMGLTAGPVRAPLRPLSADETRQLDQDLSDAFNAVFGSDTVSEKGEGTVWKS